MTADSLVYAFYQIDALGILLDDGQMPDIGEGHLLGVALFHCTPIGLELMLGALYQQLVEMHRYFYSMLYQYVTIHHMLDLTGI